MRKLVFGIISCISIALILCIGGLEFLLGPSTLRSLIKVLLNHILALLGFSVVFIGIFTVIGLFLYAGTLIARLKEMKKGAEKS